jgi:hypothetical protein
MALSNHALTELRRSAILPNDGRMYGSAGCAIPDNDCFSLIGYAERSDLRQPPPGSF